jgi:Domain of unknown function (DUF4190)/GYF domain 2
MYKLIGADGKEYGPVPAEVVRQWLAEGRANAQTRVLAEGAVEWKTLGELEEFRAETGGGVPQPIRPLNAPGTPANNSLAVIGLVLGIISIPFAFCCYGLPFNLGGIIVSLIALSQIKQTKEQGRGLAMAGLVLSLVSLVLGGLVAVVALWFAPNSPFRRIYRL